MRSALVAVGKEIQSFPYLYKLSSILLEFGELEYVYWDRTKADSNVPLLNKVDYNCVLSFTPRGKGSLLAGYVLWFVSLLRYFLFRADSKTIYYVSRLDAASAVYLAKLIRPSLQYIYLDRDAYYMTYDFWAFKALVKNFEASVARKALLHFIPGSSRDFTKSQNVRVIQNTPSRAVFEEAKEKSKSLTKDSRFTIYVNGWLVESRGAKQILEAAKHLDDTIYRIIVAGPSQCKAIEDLIRLNIVDYLGQLSNVDSLSYYFVSDVVLSLYDPTIEINQKAEPNKWYDCVFCSTPFITNSGIQTVAAFESTGLCHIVEYNNVAELVDKLHALSRRGLFDEYDVFVPDGSKNNLSFWDDRVREILSKLFSGVSE